MFEHEIAPYIPVIDQAKNEQKEFGPETPSHGILKTTVTSALKVMISSNFDAITQIRTEGQLAKGLRDIERSN